MKKISPQLLRFLSSTLRGACISYICFIFYSTVFASPINVTDDRGAALHLAHPPERIISLLPSLTESVCAVGKCNLLVGVDRFSNWPKSVDTLPKLGGIGEVNIERIVQLQPDLVLIDQSSPAISRLHSLGIPTLALSINTMEDEHRTLKTLDAIFAATQGERVWQQIQAQITRANKQLLPTQKNIRVYFEVNAAPFAAGQSSFIGEILNRLELINIIPQSLGPFPKINPEFVVQANPELIFLSDSNTGQLQQRPGWNTISAIRERHLCAFTPNQNDILIRPGPRLGEAALIISHCVQEKMSSSQ